MGIDKNTPNDPRDAFRRFVEVYANKLDSSHFIFEDIAATNQAIAVLIHFESFSDF
jgi:hypothetical protein